MLFVDVFKGSCAEVMFQVVVEKRKHLEGSGWKAVHHWEHYFWGRSQIGGISFLLRFLRIHTFCVFSLKSIGFGEKRKKKYNLFTAFMSFTAVSQLFFAYVCTSVYICFSTVRYP